MAAVYGLYTHIQSNKRRSIALLIGLFFLVYLMTYAGALLGEAMFGEVPMQGFQYAQDPTRYYLRVAGRDWLMALPWVTIGTIAWVIIAYRYNVAVIDGITEAEEVTRGSEPRL